MHAINQALIERYAEDATAAFDEHACDLSLSEVAQNRTQTFATIDERARAVFVGENVGVFRQSPAARDDDPPG